MNKKQLIVAWAMGILLVIVLFSVDYHHSRFPPMRGYSTTAELFRWGISIFIIGGLLIYTLRDKEK